MILLMFMNVLIVSILVLTINTLYIVSPCMPSFFLNSILGYIFGIYTTETKTETSEIPKQHD